MNEGREVVLLAHGSLHLLATCRSRHQKDNGIMICFVFALVIKGRLLFMFLVVSLQRASFDTEWWSFSLLGGEEEESS